MFPVFPHSPINTEAYMRIELYSGDARHHSLLIDRHYVQPHPSVRAFGFTGYSRLNPTKGLESVIDALLQKLDLVDWIQ